MGDGWGDDEILNETFFLVFYPKDEAGMEARGSKKEKL